jgi:hypothetical protein
MQALLCCYQLTLMGLSNLSGCNLAVPRVGDCGGSGPIGRISHDDTSCHGPLAS